MKTKNTSTDLYFTAALMALGSRLDYVNKSDPRHMEFTVVPGDPVFVSENLPVVVVDYTVYETEWANGTLMVNAVAYKTALQQLKTVIHSK